MKETKFLWIIKDEGLVSFAIGRKRLVLCNKRYYDQRRICGWIGKEASGLLPHLLPRHLWRSQHEDGAVCVDTVRMEIVDRVVLGRGDE